MVDDGLVIDLSHMKKIAVDPLMLTADSALGSSGEHCVSVKTKDDRGIVLGLSSFVYCQHVSSQSAYRSIRASRSRKKSRQASDSASRATARRKITGSGCLDAYRRVTSAMLTW
jgi:hypothetical protein